jgi:hypothetical protein
MTPSSVYRHCGDVRYRVIDDEAVVIRQDAGEVLGLNDIGARVLELVDGKASVEVLLEKMAGEFEIDRAQLERDVFEFLKELTEAGVIERIEATEG